MAGARPLDLSHTTLSGFTVVSSNRFRGAPLSATGLQLAQDVLGPLDYEADVSGVRNDVQIRIRQLGGDVFGTRGKHHITALPVPDVYLHADVRQRKAPVLQFKGDRVDRASHSVAGTFDYHILKMLLDLRPLEDLDVARNVTFHLLHCLDRVFADLPQNVPVDCSGRERKAFRQSPLEKRLGHEELTGIDLFVLTDQRGQAAHHCAALEPLRDEPCTGKRVRRARRDAGNGKPVKPKRLGQFGHVGWPVDDPTALHVRRYAESRPIDTDHPDPELLARLVIVSRLEAARRAAMELEEGLAFWIAILGEAERAAVLEDDTLLGGIAVCLCHVSPTRFVSP